MSRVLVVSRLLRRRPGRAARGVRRPPRPRRRDRDDGGRRGALGWARVRGTRSEAELMRAAWRGAAREVVVDPDARTTVGNMANAVNDILRVGAREVVVVTSAGTRRARPRRSAGWCARPASACARRAPRGARGGPPCARCGGLAAPPVPALAGGSEDLADLARLARLHGLHRVGTRCSTLSSSADQRFGVVAARSMFSACLSSSDRVGRRTARDSAEPARGGCASRTPHSPPAPDE